MNGTFMNLTCRRQSLLPNLLFLQANLSTGALVVAVDSALKLALIFRIFTTELLALIGAQSMRIAFVYAAATRRHGTAPHGQRWGRLIFNFHASRTIYRLDIPIELSREIRVRPIREPPHQILGRWIDGSRSRKGGNRLGRNIDF